MDKDNKIFKNEMGECNDLQNKHNNLKIEI